jgi:mitochondrial inner membrane protease ATP23
MWRESFLGTSPGATDIDQDSLSIIDSPIDFLYKWKSKFFTKSFSFDWWKVNILINSLSAMNRPVDLYSIRCPATAVARAGYDLKDNSVWICGNHFWQPFQYRRVLAHQLVNAFDFARADVDIDNTRHLACTEIRAFNLSGECDLWTKFFEYAADDWLGTKMFSRKQKCVRNSTLKTLTADPNIAGRDRATVEAVIDEVFDRCYRDHWPFTTQAHMDTRFRDSPMLGNTIE